MSEPNMTGAERPARIPITDVATFRDQIIRKLTYHICKRPAAASERDWYMATALAVRDLIVDRWLTSSQEAKEHGRKRVYYLSLEFLLGRLLSNALNNLGLTDTAREALRDLGLDFDAIRVQEPDAALGNGGLGCP